MNRTNVAQRFLYRSSLVVAASVVIWSDARCAAAQDGAPQPAAGQVEEIPLPPRAPVPAASTAPAEATEPTGASAAATDAREETVELGYNAILQGPVHEAFATPVDNDPTDGLRVYPQSPPEPIDEQAPDDQPSGEGVTWIPGYWAWSDDANKYVWVSGLYRAVPPGRTWVPGNWSQRDGGYQWSSGYWASADAAGSATPYLPAPPKSIDNGPSVPPPGEDYFWLPGQWEYVGDRYQWRSGYWTTQYEGWVWQPACYNYTPNGYVYVNGYWDLLPTDRGQLYAPVDFYSPVYLQPNYVYRPSYPLASAADLLLQLFVRRGYPNYYYGNYYGSSYASLGYRPWYDLGFGLSFFSPWNGYYNWNYRRSGIDFYGSMKRYQDHYRDNPGQRPPNSFDGDHHSGGRWDSDEGSRGQFASAHHQSMDDLVRGDIGGKSFKTIDRGTSNRAIPQANLHGQAGRDNGLSGFGGSNVDSRGSSRAFDSQSRGATPFSSSTNGNSSAFERSRGHADAASRNPSMGSRGSADSRATVSGSPSLQTQVPGMRSSDSRSPFSGSPFSQSSGAPSTGERRSSTNGSPAFSGRSSSSGLGASIQRYAPSTSRGSSSFDASPSMGRSSSSPSISAFRGNSSFHSSAPSSGGSSFRGNSSSRGGSSFQGGSPSFQRGSSGSHGHGASGSSSRGGSGGKSGGGGHGKGR